MSTPTKYDAIVIGSGQAGTPLAGAFAKAGQKTALIERTHIGGCCVNEGCTPTKTMVASGRAAYLARRGQDYGIHTAGSPPGQNSLTVDMLKVRQRKRDIVDSFRGGNENRTKDAGVDVLMGEASFVNHQTISVKMNDGTEKRVTGKQIFINTGERPAPPKLEGLEKIDQTRILDSTSVQELDVVPEHLVVIGGGYVGVEFAQLFRRLGAEVTIVQRGKQLLPREDKEVADTLLEILKEDGLTIHLESTAFSISPSSTRSFNLKIQTKGGEKAVSGTHILFAAGRIPNTEALNLSAAGITTNSRGYIVSNDFLETSAPSIYVLGDVKGPPAFTHISYDDFRIIRANVLSLSANSTKLSTKDRLVPYVVYTDPQLGHIGLHEHEARVKFPERKIKTAKMPMSYVARALETDESRGMMKAVIDSETGHILGFTCLGIEGGEVMSIVQMAMMGGVSYEKLRDAVWAHPALAESLNNIWGFLS
jgi:pyruvate/2-oxoglutarate dehydrogenase complex dihydrolipoamide dehydrogenase (E3) component